MSKQKLRKKDKYTAVIIGAGRIAAQFDSPESREVLTHAHAYRENPRINLAGFFDINKKAALAAAAKWKTKAYFDLEDMLAEIKPDIVSICTADSAHYEALAKVARHKPKIVICEKPVTTNIRDTQKIIKLYKKNNIPVLVNYCRRFDESVQAVRKDIKKNKYGKIICASGIYTKGILHNGSHLIDLCQFLFGKAKKKAVNYQIRDYDGKDLTVGGFMSFENCDQFYLMSGDEREFSIFELDIIMEKKRIYFIDFGYSIFVQKVKNDPVFSGYKHLGPPIMKKTKLNNSMKNLMKNAIDVIEKKSSLLCGLDDAFEDQKTCLSLLKK